MLYELITPGAMVFLGFIAGAVTTFFFTSLFIENKHQEDKNNVSENR